MTVLQALTAILALTPAFAFHTPALRSVRASRGRAHCAERWPTPPTAAPSTSTLRPSMVAAGLLPLLASEPALAAADAVPSALAAYGHYLGVILSMGCLVAERLTVKAGVTDEESNKLAATDALYGIAGLLLVGTGYLRATQYGKGWEFYAHEPIFWAKMTFVGVLGALSFFPTTKFIQRAVAIANAEKTGEVVAPLSEKLAGRLTSVINAELLALCSIPLAATLMARGVGYGDGWFPWQAGAATTALALFGLGGKYVKEALDWQEDELAE